MSQDNRAFLRETDIFAILSAEELDTLCDDIDVRTLPKKQTAIAQGDGGNSLFIVTSGTLSVFINDGDANVHVGTLTEGDFFGEMSLLTGTPRTATVQATTVSTVIEVTKSRLAPLMQAHGELAALMGSALSIRQNSNLKTLMEFEHPGVHPGVDTEKETVAAQFTFRIKTFFELPTSIWGKAVDGLSGMSFGGPLGFAMGGKDTPAPDFNSSSSSDERQIAFTTAIIVLAAKMTAAGGAYSQREIAMLKAEFDIPAGDMANVTRIYNRAQGSPKGFEPYARQIKELFSDQKTVLEELAGTLIRIARSDHAKSDHARSDPASSDMAGTSKMLAFAAQISGIFGFSTQEFERLKTINEQRTTPGTAPNQSNYRAVLSISEDATPKEAKLAYHKLVRENHPDKLISDGMPEEFVKQANEKLSMINVAYEQYQSAQAGP